MLSARVQARGDNETLAATALARLLTGNSGNGLGGYGIQMQDDDEDEEQNNDEDDGEEDEDDWYSPPNANANTNTTPRPWMKPHSSPQEAGVKLLKSGDFGRVEPKVKARGSPRNVNIARVISSRISKPHPALYKEDLTAVGPAFLNARLFAEVHCRI